MTTRRDRRNAWFIDHINNAPDSRVALARAFEWLKAEQDRLSEVRKADAEGFRWQHVFALAEMAMGMHRSHPEGGFRTLNGRRPRIPGGGWQPKQATGTEARRP